MLVSFWNVFQNRFSRSPNTAIFALYLTLWIKTETKKTSAKPTTGQVKICVFEADWRGLVTSENLVIIQFFFFLFSSSSKSDWLPVTNNPYDDLICWSNSTLVLIMGLKPRPKLTMFEIHPWFVCPVKGNGSWSKFSCHCARGVVHSGQLSLSQDWHKKSIPTNVQTFRQFRVTNWLHIFRLWEETVTCKLMQAIGKHKREKP